MPRPADPLDDRLPAASERFAVTSDADRRLLLRLAREAITAHVQSLPPPDPAVAGVLARLGGAFVSIHNHGDLRGCIGHIEANEPLGRVVLRCAVAACSADPRFPGVTAGEVPELEIELSLLGPLELITGADEIEIGRHGLVVEEGWNRGLLLPQVAVEWQWGPETFLAQTCHKAGLARDAWRKGARLWRFEAEVFSEQPLQGR
jgi:AmmeMemoRadiSam system protein A